MSAIKQGILTLHEVVTEREANKQEGAKLFRKLDQLFTANGVDKSNLQKAQSDFIVNG